jgi:hypothetical protein
MRRYDLRREDRQLCDQLMGIMWRDAAGDDKFMSAPMRDLSPSGAGLQLIEPVEVRSTVILRAEKLGIHGQGLVRYCSRQGIKYKIGVEFTGGMRWHPKETALHE